MKKSIENVIGMTSMLILLSFSLGVNAQTSALTVDASGRVGIGTDTPDAGSRLHVVTNTVGAVDAIYLENEGGPARINLQNLTITPTATADPVWTINSNGDLRFTAGVDGAEMRLDAAGNLKVQTSIKVANTLINVPDYVFLPDYNLMPLSELKTFVDEQGHLPEVASAEDVARDGLDMTEMQLTLLRKVEELTLYTLQQQETIDLLAEKLAKIANEKG